MKECTNYTVKCFLSCNVLQNNFFYVTYRCSIFYRFLQENTKMVFEEVENREPESKSEVSLKHSSNFFLLPSFLPVVKYKYSIVIAYMSIFLCVANLHSAGKSFSFPSIASARSIIYLWLGASWRRAIGSPQWKQPIKVYSTLPPSAREQRSNKRPLPAQRLLYVRWWLPIAW